MPKLLVEGYRPTKGDGGRWVGVMDETPSGAVTGTYKESARGAALPRGGSAFVRSGDAASAAQSNKKK